MFRIQEPHDQRAGRHAGENADATDAGNRSGVEFLRAGQVVVGRHVAVLRRGVDNEQRDRSSHKKSSQQIQHGRSVASNSETLDKKTTSARTRRIAPLNRRGFEPLPARGVWLKSIRPREFMNESAKRAPLAKSESRPFRIEPWRRMLALVLCACGVTAPLQGHAADDQDSSAKTEAVPRLTVPAQPRLADDDMKGADNSGRSTADGDMRVKRESLPERYKYSEFELFVSNLTGTDMRRLGSAVVSGERSLLAEGARQIPADYVIGVGDELQDTVWGSVDANLRLTVDRSGRIVIPRVGPVLVAGVNYGNLRQRDQRTRWPGVSQFPSERFAWKTSGHPGLRDGFTQKPGAYTVSSLSTLVNALMQSGGPAPAGSFRQIELRRAGKTLAHFDLYDLLIKGDKSADLPLQAEDVVHIGPIGPQVAVLGSVNSPAIVEMKGSETVADVLAMVGGFSAVADRTRVAVEHLSERNDRRVVQVNLPVQSSQLLSDGDMVRAFSSVTAMQPQYKQFKRVLVQGEVAHPGEYILPRVVASTTSSKPQAG